ncbi:sigma-70 family RNA polymerase sigma factor [Spirillospora sp. NPDC029432]|uniref:RNA polymerase sigma factor n=1 Tax=Spirillospora sp. NPDC029432 TaxID=3154599 RepID=UPI0034557FFE
MTGEPPAATTADEDLTALVAAARAGDPDAWQRLVETYTGMLRVRIRRYRLGREDAQDVIQTTWLLAVQNLCRLEQEKRIGSWLATIAARESLRILRRSREVCVDDLDAVDRPRDDDAASVDRRLARAWLAGTLAEAAAELPDAQRELFTLLAERPELRYVEVARALGRPIGSIGPSRARCLTRLRGLLEERGVTPDLLV